MAVFPVDPARFDPAGQPASERAERQRVQVSRQIIPNSRPAQPDNGDFGDYPDRRASFTKGLRHNPVDGRVDAAATAAFEAALNQPRDQVFAEIEKLGSHLGAGMATRRWVNPVAGRAFSVVAGDPQQYGEQVMPPAPKFGSDELSFEIVENYWMAHLRDVPFYQYETSALATEAAAEIGGFRDSARAERAAAGLPDEPLAPTDGAGSVTPRLLFRGLGPGEDKGPFCSQFLIHPVPFGAQGYHQRNRTLQAGLDFMTLWPEWIAVQNGAPRNFVPSHFDPGLHYLRNGRDLAQWVHVDVLFQGYFNACLQMLQGPDAPSAVGGGVGAGSGAVNPYRAAKLQQGFGTLGDPAHIGMLCEVAALALKAVWFQKWFVHLRHRPEVYAGRIDYDRRTGFFGLPQALLDSAAVGRTVDRYGSALLPMAFPEGSPMHPAYGAGHATVAGACVTILKALFDTSREFPHPVDVLVESDGSEHLVPYDGPDAMTGNDLTIEGELNKLASNIALGRNIAGVHWRSDGTYSLRLGEAVAIDLLTAYARSYAELAPGAPAFQFNRFDGSPVTITA